MKNLGLLSILCCLGLIACNSGTTNTTTPQTGSGSIGTPPNVFTISSLTATGCLSLTSGSSCSVQITYNATGTYQGQLSTIFPNGGYTSTISNCPITTNNSQTCTFSITNIVESALSPSQQVTIQSNGHGITILSVGGQS